ncbi:MAG: CPBP family intramembrane metalloprotease [Longimicrobiales bacterium]|nr:CPBP family intramembrane metalloprotease [Longimicrobiales bacterium]
MAPSTTYGRVLGWLGTDAEITALHSGLGGADKRIAFALVYTALVLLGHEYFFSFTALARHEWLRGIGGGGQDLGVGLAWVAARLVFWVAIPAIVVRVWHREPLAAIGWDTRGLFRHLRVYLLLYVLVLPVVLLASRRADFTATYPFMASARTDLSTFLLWECAYAVSFLALEAFFRGYLLFTCSARLGWLAIFVMVVPYTMVHFHKPWPEALGAILAGITLGAVALAYRSFVGGAVVHALVAVTMDTLAVRHAGLF